MGCVRTCLFAESINKSVLMDLFMDFNDVGVQVYTRHCSTSSPEICPLTRMPNVAAKPKAMLTVRKVPWEPLLSTSCATAPQPNIWREEGATLQRSHLELLRHVFLHFILFFMIPT